MFHLTPQERLALTWFIIVCLAGSLIAYLLKGNAQYIQWAKVSAQAIQHSPPDINTSTAQELERLPGIGLKTAQKIVAYRDLHGPFTSAYQLRYVKGISKKALQKILIFYGLIKESYVDPSTSP